MLKSIMIYSTVDGQTLSICNKLKLMLEEAGEQVTLVSLVEAKSLPLTDFDKVLIGASIRYGKHRPELYEFIQANLSSLSSMKSAFFTVNVVARKPLKNTPETNPYMQKFLQLSQWQPNLLGVFAGKIDYPKYRTMDRVMIRFIMWMTKGPTDITGTFEFTDWNKVDEFANDFIQLNSR
ncbi:menaquinone-dependent protoporphyrinogen IX dehydrogenase [Pseudomonadota bacterium]|uniref:menaquinone-dependent protoporphyrinogen IX dehydrogenase n=1 Tax=unclassified Shewanella TaxID=196818 RepID=UPI000C864890|nr:MULTISPECIES: menaquinone-dependent protoporphyrinogen IX dehydrogenase [unclassified Shewanella]MDO6776058.1 menaquinone-dependent protoporphyrinogen IX dehydrogenase [Shewanella sp. 3_MG-2023]PMG30886.1 protoporphyrinogen oxidase [Shewanella sp. 10N.286.52.C2]PMH99271.1 protoporphyrinogen oxidase [Shewanella sp. 10N.286.48.A6]